MEKSSVLMPIYRLGKQYANLLIYIINQGFVILCAEGEIEDFCWEVLFRVAPMASHLGVVSY